MLCSFAFARWSLLVFHALLCGDKSTAFSGPFAIAIGDSDMVYANWVAVDIVAQPGPSIKNRLLCLGFTTPDMPELVNYIWYREFSAIVTTRHNCLT